MEGGPEAEGSPRGTEFGSGKDEDDGATATVRLRAAGVDGALRSELGDWCSSGLDLLSEI